MKITIESTPDLITFNGILMRVWNGETQSGAKVKCLITAVSINKDEQTRKEFEDSLDLIPDADFTDLSDLDPWSLTDEVDKISSTQKTDF